MQAQAKGLKFNLWIVVLLGILLGTFISFSPASSFVLALTLLIFLFLRYSNHQDGKFVSYLFIIGIASRMLVTYFLHIFLINRGFIEGDIFGDAGDNSLRGWNLAQFWAGDMTYYWVLAYSYNRHGWTFLASFFYTLFGHSALGLKFFNCLLSSFTAIVIYFMAKEIFTTRVARLSAVLVAFFPSLFVWSLSNLKEPLIVFLISVILWSFIMFQKKQKFYYLLFLISALYLFITLRKQIGQSIIAVLLLSYFCFCLIKLSWVKKIAVSLLVIIALLGFLFVNKISLKSKVLAELNYAVSIHKGVVTTGGSVYKILDEKYWHLEPADIVAEMDLKDYVMVFFRAWGHFLFEPFLWKIQTRQMLLSYPQMILWYILVPFAILGVAVLLRYRLKESISLLVYFLIITSIMALTGGNIGTDFRHRDMITPVFLIFASVGLMKVFSPNFNLGLKRDENFPYLSTTV